MRNPQPEKLPAELAEVADTIRCYGPDPDGLQLERVRTRALTHISRTTTGRGLMKSKIITLIIAAGLVGTAGTAGVIAASNGGGSKSAAKSQYVDKEKCNSGRGNDSETEPDNDCDPGNSGGNNNGGD